MATSLTDSDGWPVAEPDGRRCLQCRQAADAAHPPANFFKHDPLQHQNSIRLLELLPHGLDHEIHCTVAEHSRGASCPPYRALSYMWGASASQPTIQLNGQSFPVGENLWSFLWHLRRVKLGGYDYPPLMGLARHIWVDALCIDQANLLERNAQVQQMGKIFERAGGVIVWLGPPDQDCHSAFDFLDRNLPQDQRSVDWSYSGWQSCLRLCQKPYWKRIWIIQEITLARQVIVMCGVRSIHWDKFRQIEAVYKARYNDHRVNYATYKNRYLITEPVDETHRQIADTIPYTLVQRTRGRFEGATEAGHLTSISSLHSAMMHFHASECLEPRDRVYALLGLSSDGLPEYDSAGSLMSGIEVDYAREPVEIMANCLDIWDTPMTEDQRWSSTYATLLRNAIGISEEGVVEFRNGRGRRC